MFIGGLAVALVGRPRITQDVDAIVLLGRMTIPGFLRSAEAAGFKPRMADAAEFAESSRVLLLRDEQSGVPIDLSIGMLPFEEAVVRGARRLRLEGLELPVATVEDLLVLKIIAGRPRDVVDIEGLLDSNRGIDRERVRAQTAIFAEVLEAPEMLLHLEKLLSATPSSRPAPRKRPKKA